MRVTKCPDLLGLPMFQSHAGYSPTGKPPRKLSTQPRVPHSKAIAADARVVGFLLPLRAARRPDEKKRPPESCSRGKNRSMQGSVLPGNARTEEMAREEVGSKSRTARDIGVRIVYSLRTNHGILEIHGKGKARCTWKALTRGAFLSCIRPSRFKQGPNFR